MIYSLVHHRVFTDAFEAIKDAVIIAICLFLSRCSEALCVKVIQILVSDQRDNKAMLFQSFLDVPSSLV